MSLAHLLLRHARLSPERVVIFNGAQPFATHGEWAARSAGLARRMREAGLEPATACCCSCATIRAIWR